MRTGAIPAAIHAAAHAAIREGAALLLAAVLGIAALAAPARAADPSKVLRFVISAAETGFDPAIIRDTYSGYVAESVFERLFTFDYLARPARLAPEAAAALPEISADGLVWTIRLKKGIQFQPDPVFKGAKRELTMQDFVYSFRRLVDPQLNSPYAWLFERKIAGLDEAVEQARKAGKMDYDSPIPGFEVVDRYTLRIHLTHPDYNLGYILSHFPTSAVAREVVEHYRDAQGQVMSHPVGTGPYRLAQWVRGARIVLEASPVYRGFVWDFQAGDDPEDKAIVAAMRGKRMPQVGRVEISVMLEDQSRWLAFQKDEVDVFQLDGPLAPRALDGDKLKPELAARGVHLSRHLQLKLSYLYWNMRDPVVGGLAPEKIALRRAVAMAYDPAEEIRVLWNGQAEAFQYPIPPGVIGHDPQHRSLNQYDPAAANKLLDRYGYKRGRDGWRRMPDGSPLALRYSFRPGSQGQQQGELWKKKLAAVGLQMQEDQRPFQELIKAEKQCQLQSRTAAWFADYADGDNFMQLFYGKNIGQSNNGCSLLPEFDALYEQSQKMPPSPERDLLYHKMARVLEAYATIRPVYARYRNMLAQPRVIGYKKHPILHSEWLFIDIDKQK
ncbi:MAG: ABC transporter substrate-binding protein [Candidatus Protistobacter heckmanni]|nr:ABC transporter substrate-binding protein [Candidatus Protistobacter heckmanni]